MIIISKTLTLSEILPDGFDLNNPLIGYKNIGTIANIAVTSEDAEGPFINLANPNTSLKWIAEDNADQTITITNTALGELDYIGIARQNFIEAESTIEIEGYTEIDEFDDPVWIELIAEHMPASDCPIMYRFPKEIYLGVRIHITNNVVAPSMAILYCGELLQVERKLYVGHSPLPLNEETDIITGVSENKEYLGRIIAGETNATVASFENISPTWYRSNIKPFAKAAIDDNPFFWAWLPETYPDEVGFAWLIANITPVNQRPNKGMMRFDINMRGIACDD